MRSKIRSKAEQAENFLDDIKKKTTQVNRLRVRNPAANQRQYIGKIDKKTLSKINVKKIPNAKIPIFKIRKIPSKNEILKKIYGNETLNTNKQKQEKHQ